MSTWINKPYLQHTFPVSDTELAGKMHKRDNIDDFDIRLVRVVSFRKYQKSAWIVNLSNEIISPNINEEELCWCLIGSCVILTDGIKYSRILLYNPSRLYYMTSSIRRSFFNFFKWEVHEKINELME